MINTSNIFEKKFLDTDIKEIISSIRNDGVYFFKSAIDKNFIDQFLDEINELLSFSICFVLGFMIS